MKQLTYKLAKQSPIKDSQATGAKYYRQDLEHMSIYQLREIARQEKIISAMNSTLEKDLLIRLILRYRGATTSLLIREYNSENYQRLEKALHDITFQNDTSINLECRARLTVYKGLEVGFYDDFQLTYLPQFAGTNAFVIDGDRNLCCVFNVEANRGAKNFMYFSNSEEVNHDAQNYLYLRKAAEFPCKEAAVKKYYLVFVARNFSEQFFRFYNGEINILPTTVPAVCVQLLDFTVLEPQTLKTTAAIDFGSSNTVGGFFHGKQSGNREKVQYAIFYDLDGQPTNMLPSVIGVESLENPNEPKYKFGFEALDFAWSSYIDESVCIFYDIKRWIADYEREEELTDKEGRRIFVKRKELLRKFFLYVIHAIENCGKCKVHSVHISSPVRQKYRFQKLFQEILPEYAVEKKDMIDEGVAVLYNTISEMIENKTIPKRKKCRALIIDCGGGTTDISSCSFIVDNKRVSYQIDIETTYENGSTDFGGNNLSYRIMQLLKLRLIETLLATRLAQRDHELWSAKQAYYGIKDNFDQQVQDIASTIPSIRKILLPFQSDMFRYVDEFGAKSIYKEFEAAYQIAEKIFPTRFKDWEARTRREYFQVRNNFYALLNYADEIKQAFFAQTGILNLILSSTAKTLEKAEGTIVLPLDKWKLTIQNSKGLDVLHDIPDVTFRIFEIVEILSPDIYGIVSKFMNPLYESGELENYSIIKLSGQSCRIDFFRSSLKEFVPGKVIKTKKREEASGDAEELKMSCIDGVLKYLRDKKFGYADISIKNHRPHIPYILTGFTHTGEEISLVNGSKKIFRGVISRNMDNLTLEVYLSDEDGTKRHEFNYYCTLDEFQPMQQANIEKLYEDKIPQDDTDNIVEREVKFFIWVEEEMEWGFFVLPIYRDDESLMVGREQFFPFEDDEWINSFFDGTK